MKIKKQPEGGSDWMGTYGDMVTLLLCFFVLLYSISSVDQAKWDNLVKSLNPNAEAELTQIVTDTNFQPGEEDVPGGMPESGDLTEAEAAPEAFEQVYENLKKMMEENGLDANVEISTGEGYTFISFRDEVFFDGNSPVLKEQGKVILDGFSGAIAPAASSIKEIQVLGHTSQAEPTVPNEVVSDRVLSAERSAQVVAYIQMKNIIEPAKLVSAAYGQFRPIDTFETREGRAKNRRAEILITKTGSAEQSLADYYAQVYGTSAEGE